MNFPKISLLWILPIFGMGLALGWWLQFTGPFAKMDESAMAISTARPSEAAPLPSRAQVDDNNASLLRLRDWAQLTSQVRRAELEKVLKIPDAAERLAQFLVRVREFDQEDVGHAVALIEAGRKQGFNFDREYEFLIQQWARVAGVKGVEGAFAEFGCKDGNVDWFTKTALSGWAEKDPTAAIAWLNAHEDHSDWPGALLSLATGLGRTNPDLAAAMLTSSLRHHDGADRWVRQVAIKNLVDQVASRGGVGGLQSWLKNIPTETDNGATHRDAFAEVYGRLDRGDHAEAQEFLTQQASDPSRNEAIYSQFTLTLAQSSPERALDWATALPVPPQSESWPGAATVFEQWMQSDPRAAERWLQARPAQFPRNWLIVH